MEQKWLELCTILVRKITWVVMECFKILLVQMLKIWKEKIWELPIYDERSMIDGWPVGRGEGWDRYFSQCINDISHYVWQDQRMMKNFCIFEPLYTMRNQCMRMTILTAIMIASQDDHLCWCARDFLNWSINLLQTVGGMRDSSQCLWIYCHGKVFSLLRVWNVHYLRENCVILFQTTLVLMKLDGPEWVRSSCSLQSLAGSTFIAVQLSWQLAWVTQM